jgi:hypothetical protein
VEEGTRQRQAEGCYQEGQGLQRAVAPDKKKNDKVTFLFQYFQPL